MFKRSLFLSLVVAFNLAAADHVEEIAQVVEETATIVAENVATVAAETTTTVVETTSTVVETATTAATTTATTEKAGIIASSVEALKGCGSFALNMIDPRVVWATIKVAANGVVNDGFVATGSTLWADHKPTLALTAIVAVAAAEYYGKCFSKAFNKAKKTVAAVIC